MHFAGIQTLGQQFPLPRKSLALSRLEAHLYHSRYAGKRASGREEVVFGVTALKKARSLPDSSWSIAIGLFPSVREITGFFLRAVYTTYLDQSIFWHVHVLRR